MQAAPPGEAPASSPLRLEVLSGKAAGFTIIVDERMVIGRQSEGPGRLADDPELSRHHAEISRQPTGEFVIGDLSSTNGTFVNGTRLEAPVTLARGDEIDLGASTIIVREAPPPSSAPEPAPRDLSDVDVRAATITIAEPPRATPRLELRLVVDLDQAEARIALDGDGDAVRLRFVDGRWRVHDGGG